MYYDYSQYIYNYLVNNDIAGKLQTIIDRCTSILSVCNQILPYVACFFFFYCGFNFIRKRWLNV